jgi:nitroreductase
MTKRDPDQVIEYRISLQDKQSEQLDSLIAAVQFKQVTSGAGSLFEGIGVPRIAAMLDDPLRIIQVIYSLATIAEALGYDTMWPTAFDLDPNKIKEQMEAAKRERAQTGEAGPAAGDFSLGAIMYNLLNPNWSWFGPPPGEGS